MERTKLEWIAAHGRCPFCNGGGLVLDIDALSCGSCSASIPIVEGAIDFLDDGTKVEYQIRDTAEVSDHPFDGNAMTIIDRCTQAGGMVLDCGSGYKARSFPHVVQMEIVNYENVDVLAVNQRLPFVDNCFDAVFSLDVLEHVDDPFTSAREICRILRPGGFLYLDIPFLQAEHGYPDHYFNATRSGLRRLFADLEVLSHHVPPSGRAIQTLHEALSIYLTGLPLDQQAIMSALTVGEILARSPLEWRDDPIGQELDPAVQWALASTTQALMKKPEGVRSGAQFSVAPADLPGFPEFTERAATPVAKERPGRWGRLRERLAAGRGR